MALLPPRLVVVIDALDECEDMQVVCKIIEAVAEGLHNGNLSYPLRFLVTSRAELRLYHLFQKPKIQFGTNPFDLHSVLPADADSDITIFFTHKLRELPNLDPGWPLPEDIRFLVTISEGLFIAASTLLRYIDSEKHPPKFRYQSLHSGHKISGLDSMYKQILSSAIAEMDPTEEIGDFKTVIGTVILASTRLTVQAMGDLLEIDVIRSIMPILTTLRPVIYTPNVKEGLVHIFHSSFHDFLVDSRRCTDNRFFIQPAEHHELLALFCLKHMTTQLSKDICSIQLHTRKNMDTDVQKTAMSLRGHLVYACRYWGGHFAKSNPDNLMELLKTFVMEHLLSWVEVLCLVGDLDGGVDTLTTVRQKLSVSRSLFHCLTRSSFRPLTVHRKRSTDIDRLDLRYNQLFG